jgi:hypothetical protein
VATSVSAENIASIFRDILAEGSQTQSVPLLRKAGTDNRLDQKVPQPIL